MCKCIFVVIVYIFVVDYVVVVVVVTIVVIVVAAVDVILSMSFGMARIFDHCIHIKVHYVLFCKSAYVAYENNLSICSSIPGSPVQSTQLTSYVFSSQWFR